MQTPTSQNASQIAAALLAGEQVLSQNEVWTFTPYVRMALPLDGFVFWVNASLVSANQLALAGLTSAAPITVQGSLHYAIEGDQSEDESIATHRVIFTTATEIQVLGEDDATQLNSIYLSEVNGVQFAFSRRDNFYDAAGLYHYLGDAVYPAMRSLVIDSLDGFDQRQVVSNSLPIWLSLANPNPSLPSFPIAPQIPLYPSYAVPDNLSPPYGSVHIFPESTRPLQGFPTFDRNYNQNQLCAERVRFTFYGLRNDDILDFTAYVAQWTLMNSDVMGIMSMMPAPRDEKRTQNELAILAMKKTLEIEISYYQSRSRTLAQQYIEKCLPGFAVEKPIVP